MNKLYFSNNGRIFYVNYYNICKAFIQFDYYEFPKKFLFFHVWSEYDVMFRKNIEKDLRRMVYLKTLKGVEFYK